MTDLRAAEQAVKDAYDEWMAAVRIGEVQRMKDKHRKLEIAEAAYGRAHPPYSAWVPKSINLTPRDGRR
jgi:hypothetical protein